MALDLVTLAEVKAARDITSSSSDAEIQQLIPRVSALVKEYVNRDLLDYYAVDKTQIFPAGVSTIFLKEVPVVEITEVSMSYDYGKTYEVLEEFDHYVHNKHTDNLEILRSGAYRPNGLKVVYKGGYAEVPPALKLAVLDLVNYYMRAENVVKASRAAGANNAQIEYITNTTMPAHIRRVLDLYRLDL